MAVRLGAKAVDALLLGPADRRRQLQDFPVLGDVWSRLAEAPHAPPDLLVIPTREKTAAAVAAIIANSLDALHTSFNDERNSRSIAYLHNLVVATLDLESICRIVLPATHWWDRIEDGWASKEGPPDEALLARLIRQELYLGVGRERPALFETADDSRASPRQSHDANAAKLATLLGVFRAAATEFKDDRPPTGEASQRPIPADGTSLPPGDDFATIVEAIGVERIIQEGVGAIALVRGGYAKLKETDGDSGESWNGIIFQVTLNRGAGYALAESVLAIKADAARQLFSIKCAGIGWAVLDSGIDHTHPAFIDHAKAKTDAAQSGDAAGAPTPPHRIKAAFDFRRVRAILGVTTDGIAKLVDDLILDGRRRKPVEIRAALEGIESDRRALLPVDWRKVQVAIERDLTTKVANYPPHSHGTHVAGIIGADLRDRDDETAGLRGVCPDIGLYDCCVLGSNLGDSEFAVTAALQFIRFLNGQSGFQRVHGANLSLAIRHNVRNYACGRTPVCLEAEALVGSGVVVVAAAGNRGFQQYQLADQTTFEGYAASSITDPGNAESVITVGSTHRHWPHTYGVSFFSSRGPTGDGRMKPDLLAPGEKIVSCVPNAGRDQMDGTSMAAPHVSGAAALLMARHDELKGRPALVKEKLCENATDLKRERSFQGHGMVDVLRAIQSL